VRRHISEAWAELGYTQPAELNDELAAAVAKERRARQVKRVAREARPPQRMVARELFARMHLVVDAGGEV
jgi:hypothetical protein